MKFGMLLGGKIANSKLPENPPNSLKKNTCALSKSSALNL